MKQISWTKTVFCHSGSKRPSVFSPNHFIRCPSRLNLPRRGRFIESEANSYYERAPHPLTSQQLHRCSESTPGFAWLQVLSLPSLHPWRTPAGFLPGFGLDKRPLWSGKAPLSSPFPVSIILPWQIRIFPTFPCKLMLHSSSCILNAN